MGDVVLTDPLGRTIILHDRTWHGHILKAHPEMNSNGQSSHGRRDLRPEAGEQLWRGVT